MLSKVLILNGHPDDNSEFEDYLKKLQNTLSKKNIVTEQLQIRNMKIGSCVGCWDCWVKTPGLCRIKDDQDMVLEKAINSDLVIFASPMIMGFPFFHPEKIYGQVYPPPPPVFQPD
jgi:multimeric flavodoxin WrbA